MSVTAPAVAKAQSRTRLLEVSERFGLLTIFVLVILAFSIIRPDTFATIENWQSILANQAILVVVALGLLIPLVGQRFDVSVGANLGLCSIVAAKVMAETSLPLAIAVVAAIACGTLIGVMNGAVISFLGVNSIITTLAASSIIGGIVLAWTEGIPISSGISQDLSDIGTNEVLSVPAIFLVAMVFAIAVWLLLTQTTFGRRLTAIGSNSEAAHLVGLNVRGVILGSFVMSGALAAIAGVMNIAVIGSGDPTVGGIQIILPALAAVFLGATAFKPGTYNVPGTVLGLLFVGVTVSGLALVGAKPWVEPVFTGTMVLVAVTLSQLVRRRRTGEAVIGD